MNIKTVFSGEPLLDPKFTKKICKELQRVEKINEKGVLDSGRSMEPVFEYKQYR